jgi:hypothetical protein
MLVAVLLELTLLLWLRLTLGLGLVTLDLLLKQFKLRILLKHLLL